MSERFISILGSTGSIGTQTLQVLREYNDIKVAALTCGSNIALLHQQIKEFSPRLAAVGSEEDAFKLKQMLDDEGNTSCEVRYGMDGLIAAAEVAEAKLVLTAIVGMIGIRPTIAAIKAGKDIALANKETLVCAGHIIMPLAKEYGVSILPVDSEHSAIFQSLRGNEDNAISRIILTASGGPFRGKSYEDLEHVTLSEALCHPNWSMGKKITIDSATMLNKGLEVIEARWLFDVLPQQIEVHVHPESILHSAVEYEDGAVIAQLGTPDMRIPIAYALTYPDRRILSGERLDLFSLGKLTFERPDMETFYGLQLAYDALDAGGNVPTVLNAANECAVALFLEEKIGFSDIPALIAEAMQEISYRKNPGVEDIEETERETMAYIHAHVR